MMAALETPPMKVRLLVFTTASLGWPLHELPCVYRYAE
jgi:hypothetical protein